MVKLGTQLKIIFAFVAGGALGFGIARALQTNDQQTETKIEPTPIITSTSPTSIEAEVLHVESDSALHVRAHLWVGQYAEFRLSPADNKDTPRPTGFESILTDSAGQSVTKPYDGQKIILKNLSPCATLHPQDVFSIASTPHKGKDVVKGKIAASVVRTIDGDTFEALAEVFPGQSVSTHVRLAGIDTPEKKGRAGCPAEAALAEKASDLARSLTEGQTVYLQDIQAEKYGGRVLATVTTAHGENMAQKLVQQGFARPYDGGTKQGWCP